MVCFFTQISFYFTSDLYSVVWWKFPFSPQQMVKRWPLFFIRPSITTGAPREFSQRDPRNMLLPGGRDIPQPCLTDELSICSSGLYEESLLQHWDHVSKRNKFVEPTHGLDSSDVHYMIDYIWTHGTCRKPIIQIFGYANALCKNLRSCRTTYTTEAWKSLSSGINMLSSFLRDVVQRQGTATVLVSHGPFPKDMYWWNQLAEKY